MTSKKSDTAFVEIMVLVLLMSLLIMGVLYIDNLQKELYLKSFISSNYNFTEDECNLWRYKMRDCYSINNCSEWSTGKDIAIPNTCSQYCHTREVQYGVECTNKPVVEMIHLSEYQVVTRSLNFDYFVESGNCKLEVRNETVLKIKNVQSNCEIDLIFVSQYNEIVCTPTTKTETYGCQDGNDVREARKLLGEEK